MADRAFAEQYIERVTRRLPGVCGVSFGLSLIPVIGLIPGVIYYRMALVAPFRRYLPLGRRFLLKWVIRIIVFLLIATQWIPLIGGAAIPLMAFVNHGFYRSSYRRQVLAEQ